MIKMDQFKRVINVFILLILSGITLAQATEVLQLGIFPRFNPDQTRKKFMPLTHYLERELKTPVQLNISQNFETFMWKLTTGKYDVVHFNQYHYIRAHKEQGYQAIVQNVEKGKATITGSLVVRRDSDIHKVTDLRGKRIIFGGGPEAMMSYIVPRQLLKKEGVLSHDYETLFARNPPNAVLAVNAGEADAAGTGSIVLSLAMISRMIDPQQMRVLVKGEPMAHLPWAVKGSMEHHLKDRIKSLMLRLNENVEGQNILKQANLTGLIEAINSDYDPHRAIVADLLGEYY